MSTISKDRLKLLIEKYLSNSLTEEETRELNEFGTLYPQLWLLTRRLQDKEQFARDQQEFLTLISIENSSLN